MKKTIVLLGLVALMVLGVTYAYAQGRAWVLDIKECTNLGVPERTLLYLLNRRPNSKNWVENLERKMQN